MKRRGNDEVLSRVTGILGQLRNAGHGGAALLIIKHHGGTDLHVSRYPAPDSGLVQLIGREAAGALAEIVSREQGDVRRLIVPSRTNLERALRLRILEHPGGTRETALALGVTARYVRMVRAEGWSWLERVARRREKQVDTRQISIFDLLDKGA